MVFITAGMGGGTGTGETGIREPEINGEVTKYGEKRE